MKMVMAKTIEDITKLTKNTTERLGVVATSVEQQTTTVSQISGSTEDLATLADELHLLVSRFTIHKRNEIQMQLQAPHFIQLPVFCSLLTDKSSDYSVACNTGIKIAQIITQETLIITRFVIMGFFLALKQQ